MTTDELRAKFKATMNALHPFWDYTRRVDGSGIHDDYMDPWLECAWQAFRAAHASLDAEVEALIRKYEKRSMYEDGGLYSNIINDLQELLGK